jgi:hypothetical protein
MKNVDIGFNYTLNFIEKCKINPTMANMLNLLCLRLGLRLFFFVILFRNAPIFFIKLFCNIKHNIVSNIRIINATLHKINTYFSILYNNHKVCNYNSLWDFFVVVIIIYYIFTFSSMTFLISFLTSSIII